jgi:hypothetical protein
MTLLSNKPLHLTSGVAPVGRSAVAGERQRWTHRGDTALVLLIAVLILVGQATPIYAQAPCGGVWQGSMPSSASGQSSLAKTAADALNSARIPGVVRAREAHNALLVEVASEAWRGDRCGLLTSIARAATAGSRGVLLPIDVSLQGMSARSAVTTVEGGSAMRWQVLR